VAENELSQVGNYRVGRFLTGLTGAIYNELHSTVAIDKHLSIVILTYANFICIF